MITILNNRLLRLLGFEPISASAPAVAGMSWRGWAYVIWRRLSRRLPVPTVEAHDIFRVPLWKAKSAEIEAARRGDALALLMLPSFAYARLKLSDRARLKVVCGVSEQDDYIWLRATGWIAADVR